MSVNAREHAERAAEYADDIGSGNEGEFPYLEDDERVARAQAHALTALALTATDPQAGVVVYAREGA